MKAYELTCALCHKTRFPYLGGIPIPFVCAWCRSPLNRIRVKPGEKG